MIPTYSKIYEAFVEVRVLRTFILKSLDEVPEYKYQIKNTLLTDYIKFMRDHSLDLITSSDAYASQIPNFKVTTENDKTFIVFNDLVLEHTINTFFTSIYSHFKVWLTYHDYFSTLSFLNFDFLKAKFFLVNKPDFSCLYYNSRVERVDIDTTLFTFCMIRPKNPSYGAYKSILEDVNNLYDNYLKPSHGYNMSVNVDEILSIYSSLISLMLFLQYMNYE